MLIDKVKIIESFCKMEIKPNDGYVAIQMNARDVLAMAKALIAVDDVLKEIGNEWNTDKKSQFTAPRMEAAEEIRKAIESEED